MATWLLFRTQRGVNVVLFEHFIEPEFLVGVAKTRRTYNDFLREFSRQSPRVISEYPKFKKFRNTTLKTQSPTVGEQERLRLTELVGFIQEQGMVERCCDFDADKPLFDNFVIANSNVQTDFVLLSVEGDDNPLDDKTISLESFEDGLEPLKNQKLVEKTVGKMCSAVSDFLRLSSHITFVEPYFTDRKSAMWDPMLSYLNASLENSPTKTKHITIVINGSNSDLPSPMYLRGKFQENLEDKFNDFSSFKVVSISHKPSGEKIHNRYMISELGALSWGIGLDSQDEDTNDDLILLDKDLYSKRYEQYVELKAFNICELADS
ncbi:conserved hypothetical protein [Vibrio chagasii]|nr:conserved hypothetical protein [Vibrio chagasii]